MKEIKLIKVGEHYDLYHRIAEENLIIGFASTDNTFVNKLSIKNCQKIERDYDLDELAKEKYPYEKTEMFSCFELDCKQEGFIEGAKTILEILGDKKFSSRNMLKAFIIGVFTDETSDYDFEFTELIQDLQQTEWDVIIEMEYVGKIKLNKLHEMKPKLDANGCLILKRKI